MAEYGLTNFGFARKPYTQIIADKEERARSFFGEDIDLSDRSPLSLFIQADSWEESKLWDEMENVYYSGYIDDAEGKQLNGLVKNIGIKRKPAQKAVGELEFFGNPQKVVAAGTKAMTESGIVFQTTETVVINDSGYATASIEAVDPGILANVAANTINKMFNAIEGVDSVSNPEKTSEGAAVETDEELRERYYRSLSRRGKSTREAVEAALLDIESVKDAYVIENATNKTVDGVPPKSLAPYVVGGDDKSIAKAILESKAAGIQSYGEIVVDIEDSRNYTHRIGYTKAKIIDIFIEVKLIKNTMFKPGFENIIKSRIISYIGGYDADGTEYKGLGLGQDVKCSKIIALSNDMGIDDVVVKLSQDSVNYYENNIEVPIMEIAATSFEKVNVT